MDSDKLSKRSKQPGHDRSFETSESLFVSIAQSCLPDDFILEEKPHDLKNVYENYGTPYSFGIAPEAAIYWIHDKTFRIYFEVKKQGERGNAEERSFKHHTVKFVELLKKHTGLPYHAYTSIFCEALAVHPRYTVKIKNLIQEPHYFFWVDYQEDLLCGYIQNICTLIKTYAQIRLSLNQAEDAADKKRSLIPIKTLPDMEEISADILIEENET